MLRNFHAWVLCGFGALHPNAIALSIGVAELFDARPLVQPLAVLIRICAGHRRTPSPSLTSFFPEDARIRRVVNLD